MQFKNWGESYRAIRMWGNVGDDLKLICGENLIRRAGWGGISRLWDSDTCPVFSWDRRPSALLAVLCCHCQEFGFSCRG